MRTTSSQHVLYYPGLHTRYNGRHNRLQNREVEPILKAGRSSDCRLQLAYMKLELLVNARQHSALNTFPGIVHTARHVMGAGNAQSRYPNFHEREPPKVGLVTRTKS